MQRQELIKVNLIFLSWLSLGAYGQRPTPNLGVAIQGPAYLGEPIWAELTGGHAHAVIYPFTASFENIGCNKIELKRGETKLQPLADRRLQRLWSGPPCGTQAAEGAPTNRLSLHLLFRIDQPGDYSVRWTDLSHNLKSEWVSFTVVQPEPEQREAWLSSLLASPPRNAGLLVGDFLPSLAAALPDKRAVTAFAKYAAYSNFYDPRVAAFASAGLEHLLVVRHAPANK